MVIHEKDYNRYGCPICNFRGAKSSITNGRKKAHGFKNKKCPECKTEFTIVVNPNECVIKYVEKSLKDKIARHPKRVHFWP